MNKSAAGLCIFRSRKRQEFQKTLTVFPSVSSTWWTKRKQQWLNAFPLLWETSRVLSWQKMEATACSPPPSPPSPTPRLRLEHWHIHAGGPERSVEITIQHFGRITARSGRPNGRDRRWRGDARWTPIFHRERCCHKIITIQGEERETNTAKLPSDPGNSFHWSSKEHVVLTHQTAKHVKKWELSMELRPSQMLCSFQWIYHWICNQSNSKQRCRQTITCCEMTKHSGLPWLQPHAGIEMHPRGFLLSCNTQKMLNQKVQAPHLHFRKHLF